MFMNQ